MNEDASILHHGPMSPISVPQYNSSFTLSLEPRQNSTGNLSGDFIYYVNGRNSDMISEALVTIQFRNAEHFIRCFKETAADFVFKDVEVLNVSVTTVSLCFLQWLLFDV